MMSIGIYKITSPSGKVYVGQSIDIKKRWRQYELGHCKHQCHLYNSFRKHGYGNHIFEILFTLNKLNLYVLNRLEVAYIEYYDCLTPNGLNLQTGGDSKKQSLESIKKMSDSKIALGMTLTHKDNIRIANKARSIKVDQYSKSGEYIQTFNSLTDAGNSVGCGNASIVSVCRNKYGAKSTKGYKWKYHNTEISCQ